MAGQVVNPDDVVKWEGSRDDEGNRTYMTTWKVITDLDDGPGIAMTAAGLPTIGSTYNMGNAVDIWTFCTPFLKAVPIKQGERQKLWHVQQKWTTASITQSGRTRCQDEAVENPILEPDQIGGSFVNREKLFEQDRNGAAIQSSSFETIQVPGDESYATVRIRSNRLTLPLSDYTQAMNKVNDTSLWGLPARTVKLSNLSWERSVYGVCTYYYPVTFEFDINFNTFDRDDIIDQGEKVLKGWWDEPSGDWVTDPFADYTDPSHYIKATDINGNHIFQRLDGLGEPQTGTNPPPVFLSTVELYDEYNFLTLGIPAVLA